MTEPLTVESISNLDGSQKPGFGEHVITAGRSSTLAEHKEWLFQKVKAGEKLEYYVHVANQADQQAYLGLFCQLDYKQIPLLPGGPLNLFVTVPADEVRTYRLSLIAPPEKGVHELYVYGAIRPLATLTLDNPDDAQIEHSARIAIKVE